MEDDIRLSNVLMDALEDWGWNVTRAWSGDDAKHLLQQSPAFDALITDVRMPGATDGISLARHARRTSETIRILVMSGFSGERTNSVILEGLGSFLAKPFTISQLEEELGSC